MTVSRRPTAPIAKRLSTIEAGRRKGGILGAAMAGAMLGLRDIYDGPPKDDTIVAIVESPDEPVDIDTDGIEVSVGDVDVWAPPPHAPRRRGRRSARRLKRAGLAQQSAMPAARA